MACVCSFLPACLPDLCIQAGLHKSDGLAPICIGAGSKEQKKDPHKIGRKITALYSRSYSIGVIVNVNIAWYRISIWLLYDVEQHWYFTNPNNCKL